MGFDVIEAACAQATRSGESIVALRVMDGDRDQTHSGSLSLLAEAANRRGDFWFYASRSADGLQRLGLGRAWDFVAHDTGSLAAVRGAAERLECCFAGERNPALFMGGAAFDARPEADRAAEWRTFGSARFWIPEVRVDASGGRTQVITATQIWPGERPAAVAKRWSERTRQLLDRPAQPTAGEPRRSVPALVPSLAYARSIEEVLGAIRAKRADKVVLADAVRATLEAPVSISRTLEKLGSTHPGCLSFGLSAGGPPLVGATPERLVKLDPQGVEACAVAGTEGTRNTEAATSLLSSVKERSEHDFVVAAIAESLSEFCNPIQHARRPELLGTNGLQHLFTSVRGVLKNPTHILEIAESLHPTPALGGTPRAAALSLIRQHEPHDRGWYAGPIGWFDARGEGEFCVALRCGLLDRNRATLYAGSGVVEASEPELEVEETALKLNTLWTALETS